MAPSKPKASKAEASFDGEAFARELREVRDATKPTEADETRHRARLEFWTAALGFVGLLLSIRGVVSPVAMVALGIFRYAQFAILAHHSLHGGWGTSRRGSFAQGFARRCLDWLDWIFPAAWIVEHNKGHHYSLNEDADPDYVERNTATVREMPVPLAAKYLLVAGQMTTWKWFYYASNTLKLLHADRKNAPQKLDATMVTLTSTLFQAVQGNVWYRALAADLLFRVFGPTILAYYIAVPVFAGLLHGSGPVPFCGAAFLNMLGAEAFTNAHAFCTIVTNHAGSDLWAFEGACKADTPEFYLRAVLGSTAYQAGNDLVDYLHGYLNYQGEHHAFPALSPLHYQRLHPHFKRVCERHGVPYVQESVFLRTKKTVDIIVGTASQPRIDGCATEQPALWRKPSPRQ